MDLRRSTATTTAAASVLALLLSGIRIPAADLPGRAPADLPRPRAIVADGVPPIPRAIADGLHRYQEIRPAGFVDWVPGDGILVAKRLTKVHQLYRVAEPLARPAQLTGGDDPVSAGLYMADGSLIFSRGRGGDEDFQI
jgi:hypothetical protein